MIGASRKSVNRAAVLCHRGIGQLSQLFELARALVPIPRETSIIVTPMRQSAAHAK